MDPRDSIATVTLERSDRVQNDSEARAARMSILILIAEPMLSSLEEE